MSTEANKVTSLRCEYDQVMIDWKSFNPEVIAEFRSNQGKVAQFGDLPVVILHTIGARSGGLREVPLIVVLKDNRMLLFGTNAGSNKHPAWIFNLRANPVITVEFGTERFTANILELAQGEAQQILQTQAESTPQLASYLETSAPRVVPVFSINRV
ncbi:MAG: nitroreductase family deazaflavin-dependent oxidoreductase [bacterium]|nr:nitroreductase family deazaflavin-dependent oxidoreductase [Gammaproteobacteria bacterium]HIL94627.1 nitroreductase family deazaflavin-dependent oxidoreductase [Pseudomonadales bacterium]